MNQHENKEHNIYIPNPLSIDGWGILVEVCFSQNFQQIAPGITALLPSFVDGLRYLQCPWASEGCDSETWLEIV